MRKSRFTNEQIIAVLKEAEAGASAADVCRRHGISDQTFYRWKAKFGGMDVSEARRLKELDGNRSPNHIFPRPELAAACAGWNDVERSGGGWRCGSVRG